MKAANGNFDQWREDARFLCDQYSYAESRCNFYYNETYIVKKHQLQPQLDRWLVYRENVNNSLLTLLARGQRWQIAGEEMQTIFRLYLPFDISIKFIQLASQPSRG